MAYRFDRPIIRAPDQGGSIRLDDFELERWFARFEFTVRYVLCASDIEPLRLSEVLALATPGQRDQWEELGLGYIESEGTPALRTAIASLYQGLEADDVLVFTGGQEAVFACFSRLEPGDHVIAPAPAYRSLIDVARGAGAEVTEVALERAAGRWRLDPEAVARALRPSTRVIVVNFPHNPTGALATPAEFARLADLAAQAGALFFSDEVYRGLEDDPAARLAPAAELPGRTASFGVMSKVYGLAGLRVGWIASRDRALLQSLARRKDYLSISGSAPSEWLATVGLGAHEKLLERARTLLSENRVLLDDFFQRHADSFDLTPPSAGTMAFPAWRKGSADRLAEELLRREQVLLLPGSVYGADPASFRIGFGRRNFPAALAGLERLIAS